MRRTEVIAAISVLLAGGTMAAAPAQAQLPTLDVPPVVAMPPVKPLPPAGAPAGDQSFAFDPSNPSPFREPAAAKCAPAGTFTATIRNVSPGLAAADPRAQPRQMWRQGALYLKNVDPPAPNGSQRVVTIAEPNIWMYDEATRTGAHTVDPGPDLEVRAPILPEAPNLPPELAALEFGCELDFVAARAPNPQQMINWGSVRAGLHVYGAGEHSVAILVDARRNYVLMLSYLRRGQPVLVLRYDNYRRGLPERPEQFQPPRYVIFTEGSGKKPPLD